MIYHVVVAGDGLSNGATDTSGGFLCVNRVAFPRWLTGAAVIAKRRTPTTGNS